MGHSRAVRSQPPVVAAAPSVVERKSSGKASGSAALQTVSYGRMNSRNTVSKRAPGVTGLSRKPAGSG
jgi:hypothetical protein